MNNQFTEILITILSIGSIIYLFDNKWIGATILGYVIGLLLINHFIKKIKNLIEEDK